MKYFWQAVKFSNHSRLENRIRFTFYDNQSKNRKIQDKAKTRNERVYFVAVERNENTSFILFTGIGFIVLRLNVAELQPSIPYHSVTRIFDARLHD